MKALGCVFALDNFGGSVSTFSYLKNLPVDMIKIDGSYIRDIDSDKVNRAMVKSINDIARVMGKKTIAENVESQAILDQLTEIGVDYVQGYFLGKPMPIKLLV
jgi:Amt family ammonium transporter